MTKEILEKNEFVEISKQLPPDGLEVIFYNEKWKSEFNPNGCRAGFYLMDDFISAYYWASQDGYETIAHWLCDDDLSYSDEIKQNIDPTHWKYIINPFI